jgi:hypothetical protein
MTVTSNVFSARQGNLDRAESIDTSYATLAYNSFKNINFSDNTFNGMNTNTVSPLYMEHVQATEASTWAIDTGGRLPFGGRARNLVSFVTEGAVTDSGGTKHYEMPYCEVEKGSGAQTVNLRWPAAVKGKVQALIRGDNPI